MKKLLLLALLTFTSAFADDSLVQGSLTGATRMLAQADAEGAALANAKLAIIDTAKTWSTERDQYEADNRAALEQDKAYQAKLAKHNEWVMTFAVEADRYNAQCSGSGDQNYVNQCMNWKGQLQPIANRIDAEKSALDVEKASLQNLEPSLNQRHDALAARWAAIDARVKANEAAGQAYLAKREQIIREMQQLVDNFNSQCKAAVGAGNNDRASEVCGQAFDGNVVHEVHLPDPPPATWTSFTSK